MSAIEVKGRNGSALSAPAAADEALEAWPPTASLPMTADRLAAIWPSVLSKEKELARRAKNSERRGWVAAAAFGIVALCEGAALAALMPLKQQVPIVITQYRDGIIRTVYSWDDETPTEKTNALRQFLFEYVVYRESYSWFDNQWDYDHVIAMSTRAVGQAYAAYFLPSNRQSPQNLIGNKGTIRILPCPPADQAVQFEQGRPFADVCFEKILQVGQLTPKKTVWRATLGYKMNGPIDANSSLYNSHGIFVTYYDTKEIGLPIDATR